MDPRSEVLLRQAELFQGPLLIAGAPPDGLLAQLPQAHAWTWHAGDHALLESRFVGRCHCAVEPPAVDVPTAVLCLPKSRELAAYLLTTLAARLQGGTLYVVGEKRGGIESVARHLQAFGKPRKLDSARHCQLWQVSVEQAPQAAALHTLAKQFELSLPDGPLQVVSLPGVFSHGRLDRGTAVLLRHLEALPEGHVLDFGCGAGVLGAAVKRRYPGSHVTMLDVDAFAVAASRLTLAANGLEAEVVQGDGIDAAPLDLEVILSNPPFHTGVHTDYQASENLLQKSAIHLRKGGQIRLVANTFLRYKPIIEAALGNCQVLEEADGFRIYQATR
ncbi:class I SAM-dependent methyltransferase [Pseudomonas fulva]|uniref:class I SAM-dependent methyltransferase n=1 Tax=Pseudomonas fulva TaxID=47880 RepID=UPI0018A93626|nr:class I SAM-dependent methyltransferase [Pseudomonas fulva]MBF8680795.1 class I SAM-dependent methyltransferase [Pseudomonas fulva]MBF8719753.1 class I SAM-dependent methyltransferase [Pseudomonas fulva]MBF8783486.1 class I SAM-dependent methyltransferase [Pseudomonas fulva]